VVVTHQRDGLGYCVAFRIAGPKVSVEAEIERIVVLCTNRAVVRIMGPYRWGDEWIAHGELRELS
jgi:hypothetical protein